MRVSSVSEALNACERAAGEGFSSARLEWEPTQVDLAELVAGGMWAVGVSVATGDGQRTESCHVSWEAGLSAAG